MPGSAAVNVDWEVARIFSKSYEKTLLLILLTFSSALAASMVVSPVAEVHGAGSFNYTLSNSGGVTITPGTSGSTTIVATLIAGTPSNVTLICDLSILPTEFAGTTCIFSPTSITPSDNGTSTTLTVQVPPTAFYSAYNITVTNHPGSQAPIVPTVFTLTVGAKIALNPTAFAATTYSNGTIFTVELNVTYSPTFSGFTGALLFNEKVLSFQGVDFSQSVLGSDAQPSSECLDGVTAPNPIIQCTADLSYDSIGVFSLALFTSSGENITAAAGTTINGELFKVSFKVIHPGFSTLHFVQHEIQTLCTPPTCYNVDIYNTVSYDGYFTNDLCGGALCKPPSVSFTPPARPVVLRPASFNSTTMSQNPSGVITEYNWTFSLGPARYYYNYYYNATKGGRPVTNATFIFNQFGGLSGGWVVTLGVQDSYGARAYSTQTILVFRVWVDLGLRSLAVDPTVGVLPGTPVKIVVTTTNNGVNPENSTIRLVIYNQNVANQSIMNLQPASTASLNYTWETNGLSPRIYPISVSVDEVRDPITGRNLENDTAIINGHLIDPNNARVAFVQIIPATPGGFGLFLGLSLPETFGLGIVVVAVAGFVFGIVKKSRAPPPEPL